MLTRWLSVSVLLHSVSASKALDCPGLLPFSKTLIKDFQPYVSAMYVTILTYFVYADVLSVTQQM